MATINLFRDGDGEVHAIVTGLDPVEDEHGRDDLERLAQALRKAETVIAISSDYEVRWVS